MKYNLNVKDDFFFVSLILIPVAALFKYMFLHAGFALVISLLIYHFMPKIKYIRAQVKGTDFFYYFGLDDLLFFIWDAACGARTKTD